MARLKACKERLEREKAQARESQQKKLGEREEKEERTGKKPRGRKPKSPDDAEDKEAKANRQHMGVEENIGVGLADAGYWSEDNLTKKAAGDIELLVATRKDWKQRKALRENPPVDELPPEGLTATEKMERKLQTDRGRELYKIRGRTIEPVFSQIKEVRGFRSFMRRGLDACRSEWSLICATHNVLKLWRSGKAVWLT